MDIDGVINNYLYCERMKNEPKNPDLPLLTEMDLSMMKRIVRLATETNSDIVLSSSWKAVWNYKKKQILAKPICKKCLTTLVFTLLIQHLI